MPLTKTKILASSIAILVLSLILVSVYLETTERSNLPDLTRVACVGDSITQITAYPNDLQSLLGSGSSVGNFGASGSTVSLTSVRPYLYESAFQNVKDFMPTSILIMLGTNDARVDVYPSINRFVNDYKTLIAQFQLLKSKPQIFLIIPPPFFNNTINLNSTDFSSGVIPRIEQVANEMGLRLIDLYTPLLNHSDYFVDGVHPNLEGSQVIANEIFKQITTYPN